MYLVHVALRAVAPKLLSDATAQVIMAYAREGDGVEHVVVHPGAPNGPLAGVYVLAADVETAEATAVAVCRRAVAAGGRLAGVEVLGGAVRLVPQFYDQRFRGSEPGRHMPRQH